MTLVAVLDDYQGAAMSSADWGAVQQRAEVQVIGHPLRQVGEAASVLAGAEVLCLMRERLPMTAELLDALPRLRCIVTTGAANRAIDLEAARERGVVVCGTTNGLGRIATAELTWGLVLALARSIPREDRATREGRWQVSVGTALHGKTFGVLGLGGVGRHLARYAQAFGMEVIAWSRNLDEERALDALARRVEFDELVGASDVLSVNVVLSDETRGMIDAQVLRRMKRTAFLVNTSRGPIITEADLVAALQQGEIAGAALDVFDVEPLPPGSPLLGLDNVVLTPHLGYVTQDVYDEFFRETVRAVLAYLDGEPINVLTPDASAPAQVSRRYEDR